MNFKIGRLYFRYIQRSKLETFGYSALKLARELEKMGYIKVDGDHYQELKTLPRKRPLVEELIDKNNLEAPLKGIIKKIDNGKSEIRGSDKRTYLFDSSVLGEVQLKEGDHVTFKTAYTIGNLHCARSITKEEQKNESK